MGWGQWREVELTFLVYKKEACQLVSLSFTELEIATNLESEEVRHGEMGRMLECCALW